MTADCHSESAGLTAVTSLRRGPVLVITMNRPTASNALNSAMLQGLSLAVEEARQTDCRAVVLAGSGRNFCAGADLKGFAVAGELHGVLDLRHQFHPLLLSLWSLPKPVVAAVNGAAAGGGLGLACAADLRIATPQSRLVPAWVNIGLVPDMGASSILVRWLGYARAMEFIAAGQPMLAERALALGLVNAVVPDDLLLDTACERAEMLGNMPGRSFELTKGLLRQAETAAFAAQLEAEATTQSIAASVPGLKTQIAERLAVLAHNRTSTEHAY